MSPLKSTSIHKEVWLLLPWLANGRLSSSQREWAEEHLRVCPECARELSIQRRICESLETPDRVTYAPAASFRKLLDRLDEPEQHSHNAAQEAARHGERARAATMELAEVAGERDLIARGSKASLWRPPGLAWAASFIVMVGLTAVISTAYRWSEPRYATRTDAAEVSHPGVLHIAFQRDLTISEVEESLRASGARVVEGPGNTGIFGVTTLAGSGGVTGSGAVVESGATTGNSTDSSASAHSGNSRDSGATTDSGVAATGNDPLVKLAARLRADPRVRWVEPIEATASSASQGP